MRTLEVEINGQFVRADVEPRTHLADFLRDQRFLTATHIGCEHGVCGACTVLIEGSPARSCITYAVTCEGAKVTTLEGLVDDPVIVDLREAFSNKHALQCGYCTPGMLISCRDIITRVPDADEARIRLELSGNLCRCTGYVGIVAAVQEVQKKHRSTAAPAAEHSRRLGPVGAIGPAIPQARGIRRAATTTANAALRKESAADNWQEIETSGIEISESFIVPFPREKVWMFFSDLEAVADCMPGAQITAQSSNDRAEGVLNVRLGPIVTAFFGRLEITRDNDLFKGTVRGAGRDSKSASAARGIVGYQLNAIDQDSSQVDISLKYLLTGALAQFGRAGLIKSVADHITHVFAQNLEARLSGKSHGASSSALNAFSLARFVIWKQIRSILSKVAGLWP
jgi:aerobic carbon-monoxide dehydrogenase small subunit